MSAAKHTQGPLQVLDHPQDGVFILDAGSRTLAKVVYLLNPHERMANAHLFAAAPELLEALIRAVDATEYGPDHPSRKQWDALIAKATRSRSMNTEPHRIVGRSDVPCSEAKCIQCHQPFKPGKQGDPGVNVYSKDGMREVAISGLCESCFDSLFDDVDEDDGDYCQGCNPEPTIGELESGTCASCGKEIL